MSRPNKESSKICSLEFGKTSQKNFSGYQQDLNPGGFGEKAASIPTTPRYPTCSFLSGPGHPVGSLRQQSNYIAEVGGITQLQL